MKTKAFWLSLAALALATSALGADTPKESVFDARPLGIRMSVKMVGPYTEPADLQLICLFKHKTGGDNYQGAAKDTDAHLGGLLSALRNRGEFVGDLGETILVSPAKGTIPARRFMVIGLGEEKDLSLECLRLAGRIAAREATRLGASRVAWAPVIRDQGNSTLDVGEGDRAFAEQFLEAADTEMRLQAQGLAPKAALESLVIEAGPAYFDSAVKQVGEGIAAANVVLATRESKPYSSSAQ